VVKIVDLTSRRDRDRALREERQRQDMANRFAAALKRQAVTTADTSALLAVPDRYGEALTAE
jgi:hypothetical protein